jgi:hypothetical protein
LSACLFQRRAALYGRLDAHLHHKTRFFGAACVTNRVLGHMASHTGHFLCSDDTYKWLLATGALLETTNIAIAKAVASGRLTGPSLDGRIVSIEQSIVEEALQSARTAQRYPRLLSELNAHLNSCAAGWMHFWVEVRWYSRVLSAVRETLASPIEFAAQAHREAIGLALIAALQRAPQSS